MRGKSKRDQDNETTMEMTPMIDVTFLLLIFFLCTIKFRLSEGYLASFLPKDQGVNSYQQLPIERLHLSVDRVRPVDTSDPDWVWREDQIRLSLQGQELSGLEDLYDSMRAALQRDSEVKAVLAPLPGSLYIDSVKVVNECLRAGFRNLTLTGVRLDS